MSDTALSMNMQNVIDNLQADETLIDARTRSLIQSVEKLCRWLDLPPDRVPARRIELRAALERLNASQLGIKKKTFQNVLASVNTALKLGADGHYRAKLVKPDAAWQALLEQIEVEWRRQKIDQLARYASANNIASAEVTARTFGDWLGWRQEHAPLLRKPERAVNDAWATWNWLARKKENWPTGPILRQNRQKLVRLDRAELPEALVTELEAYEARMTRVQNDDLLSSAPADTVSAVVPKVARNRILAIELCAAALVEEGWMKPADLTSIKDIVSAEYAHLLVNNVRKRNGGAYTHYHRSLLEHLRSVAAQYIGFEGFADPEAERARFNHMIKVVSERVGHGDMTEGNKQKLTQFDDPENIARLVNLPAKVFDRLEDRRRKQGFVTCQMSYDARAAIAITVLLTLPVRRANLVDLRVGKELVLPHSKRDAAKIVIAGENVKNDQSLTCLIPEAARELIELYLIWYRPVLIAGRKSDRPTDLRFGDGDHYLLPVKGGAPMNGDKLRTKLVDLVKRETGLDVTVHFFRHFAGSLIMRANPALASAAGAILGHKDGSRVTRVYAKVPSERAAETFETVKQELSTAKRRPMRTQKSRLNRVRRGHVR